MFPSSPMNNFPNRHGIDFIMACQRGQRHATVVVGLNDHTNFVIVQLCVTLFYANGLSSFSVSIQIIVRLCSCKQMIRPNASPIVAGVQSAYARTKLASVEHIRISVSTHSATINGKAAIPIAIYMCLPFPAAVQAGFNFHPEKGFGKRGISTHVHADFRSRSRRQGLARQRRGRVLVLNQREHRAPADPSARRPIRSRFHAR